MDNKIEKLSDFSSRGLGELKAWIEIWMERGGCCIEWEDVGVGCSPTVEELMLALGLDAFWKLDESSGIIAYDSSGNHHDLTAGGGKSPPTWGQAVGPPGDTTALWVDNTTQVSGTLSAFTDNFTAGLWVRPGSNLGELIGQGTSYHGSTVGWNLMIVGKFAALINGTPLYGNDTVDVSGSTWYFVVVVRDSGTWKLYVNGQLQAATATTSPGVGSSATWLGNDDYASHSTFLTNTLLSYAFIANRVVSAVDLQAIYNAGV